MKGSYPITLSDDPEAHAAWLRSSMSRRFDVIRAYITPAGYVRVLGVNRSDGTVTRYYYNPRLGRWMRS